MKLSNKLWLLLPTLMFCCGITISAEAKVCFLVGGCGSKITDHDAVDKITEPPVCEKMGYTRTVEFCCNRSEDGIMTFEGEPGGGDFHLDKIDNGNDHLYVEDTYSFFEDKSGLVWDESNICSYIQDEGNVDITGGSGACDSRNRHYTRRCKCDPIVYQYVKPNDNETNYEIRKPSCTDEGVEKKIFGQHIAGVTRYMYKVCEHKYPYHKKTSDDSRSYSSINTDVLLTNSGTDYAHYKLVNDCHSAADGLNREIHTQSYNDRYTNTQEYSDYSDDKYIASHDGTTGSCVDKYDLRPNKDDVTRYAKCICPKGTYKYPKDDRILKISGASKASHVVSGNTCNDLGTSHDSIDFGTTAVCSGQNNEANGQEVSVGGYWREYKRGDTLHSSYNCQISLAERNGNSSWTNKVADLVCRVYVPRTCGEFHTGSGTSVRNMTAQPMKGWRIDLVDVKDNGGGLYNGSGTDCSLKCYSYASGPCQVGDFMNSEGYCSGASKTADAKADFKRGGVAENVIGMVSVSAVSGDTRTIRVVALTEPETTYTRSKSTANTNVKNYTIGGVGNWRLMTNADINGLLEAKDSNGNLRKLQENSEMKFKNKRTNMWAVLIDKIKTHLKGTILEFESKACEAETGQKYGYAFADIYQCYWVNHASNSSVQRGVLPRIYSGDKNGILEDKIASKDNWHPRFSYGPQIYMRKVEVPDSMGGRGVLKYSYEFPFWYSTDDTDNRRPDKYKTKNCHGAANSSEVTLVEVLYGRSAYVPLDGNLEDYVPLPYGIRYYLEDDNGTMYYNRGGYEDDADKKIWPKGVQPWRINDFYAGAKTEGREQGACRGSGSGFTCHMRMYYKAGGEARVCSNYNGGENYLYSTQLPNPAITCYTENENGDVYSGITDCRYIWDYRGGTGSMTYDTKHGKFRYTPPYFDHVHGKCVWVLWWWYHKGNACHDPNGQVFMSRSGGVSDWYERGIQGCFTRGAKEFSVKTDGSGWKDVTSDLPVGDWTAPTEIIEEPEDTGGDTASYAGLVTEYSTMTYSQMSTEDATQGKKYCSGCAAESSDGDVVEMCKYESQARWNIISQLIDLSKAVKDAKDACDRAASSYSSAASDCNNKTNAYNEAVAACTNATDEHTKCLKCGGTENNCTDPRVALESAKDTACNIASSRLSDQNAKCGTGGNATTSGTGDPRVTAQNNFNNKVNTMKNSEPSDDEAAKPDCSNSKYK